MVKRKSLIIYYNSHKAIEALDSRVINVAYVSKKAKYAVIYLDDKKVYDTKKYLVKAKGIRDVIESKLDIDYYNF